MTRIAQRNLLANQEARIYIHIAAAVVCAALVMIGLWQIVGPTTASMTTRDALAYVPAHIEVVEDITSVLVTREAFGGTDGIGIPQIERSLEAYQANERTDVTHYAVVRSAYQQTIVEYYDFQPNGVVVHTTIGPFEAPEHRKFGLHWGYFQAGKGRIVENELVVDRQFYRDERGSVPIILSGILFGIGYLVWLRPIVNKLIVDRILPIL